MKNTEIKTTDSVPVIDFPPRPQESDYIICYVDMLGSKALISQTDLFETIYNAFTFALNVESKLKIFGQLEFKVFSDNILIAQKVEDPTDKEEVTALIRMLLTF